MNLLIIGPQGCGKGTQAKIISENLKIPHISTGDLFRNAKNESKQELEKYMNQGLLVPDELVAKILKQRINQDDAKNGFILDGYPRNKEQNELLKNITKIDKVIEINLSDKEAIKRISSRLSCKSCGAIFNKITKIPKQENICDNCKGKLYQRDDDKPEAVKKRLEIYKKQTQPILEQYQNKLIINGEQSIEKIAKEIKEKI